MRAARSHTAAPPAPRTKRLRPRRPGRPPGPSRTHEARARLLEEASLLYASGGDAGLSYGVLAARAGLTKATLFHYFPSKQALLLAVFASFGERLDGRASDWFDAPPAGFAARLDRVVAGLVDFYGADPVNARILCHGLLETARGAGSVLAGTASPPAFARFVRRFTEFIRAGIAAGEFHDARPLATVLSIGGAVLFELMLSEDARRQVYGGTLPDLAERRGELTALIRRAVVRPKARLAGRAHIAPRARKGRR